MFIHFISFICASIHVCTCICTNTCTFHYVHAWNGEFIIFLCWKLWMTIRIKPVQQSGIRLVAPVRTPRCMMSLLMKKVMAVQCHRMSWLRLWDLCSWLWDFVSKPSCLGQKHAKQNKSRISSCFLFTDMCCEPNHHDYHWIYLSSIFTHLRRQILLLIKSHA